MNKNLLIFSIVLLIVVIFIAFYFLFVGKNDQPNNQSIIISKQYQNKNIGISFSYPIEYGQADEKILSHETNPEITGQALQISFGENFERALLMLVTKDYTSFYKNELIRTQDDIEIFCPYLDKFNPDKINYCNKIEIAGQETVQNYSVVVDEGVAFVYRLIYISMPPGSTYTGLTLAQGYPTFSNELEDYIINDSPEFLNKSQEIIEELVNNKVTDSQVKKQIDDFEEIILSLKIN